MILAMIYGLYVSDISPSICLFKIINWENV